MEFLFFFFGVCVGIYISINHVRAKSGMEMLNGFKRDLKEEVRIMEPNSAVHFVISIEKDGPAPCYMEEEEEEEENDPSEYWKNN